MLIKFVRGKVYIGLIDIFAKFKVSLPKHLSVDMKAEDFSIGHNFENVSLIITWSDNLVSFLYRIPVSVA